MTLIYLIEKIEIKYKNKYIFLDKFKVIFIILKEKKIKNTCF